MKIKVLIVIFLCFATTAMAQKNISGRILDKEYKTPLIGVLVEYNSDIQTFSDTNGVFSINLPTSVKKNDSLHFYMSGFEPLKMPISKLSGKKNIVKMSALSTNLNTVCIKDFNKAKALIKEVILHRSRNYPTDTTISTFYYRNIYFIDSSLCCFEEGTDKIVNSGYADRKKSSKNTTSAIYELPLIHQLLVYDTNSYTDVINFDELVDFRPNIKNHVSPFNFFDVIQSLSPSMFSNMTLSKFEENNQKYYKISLDGTLFDRDSLCIELTINKENFALEKFKYNGVISQQTLKIFRVFVRDIRKYSAVAMQVQWECEYKQHGGKYFLYSGTSSISTNVSYNKKSIEKHSLPETIFYQQRQNFQFQSFDTTTNIDSIFQKPKFTQWEQISPYNPTWKVGIIVPKLEASTKDALLKKGLIY